MNERPVIKIKKSRFQKIIDLLTFLMILGIFIYIIYVWKELPDRMPIHFNSKGEPDSYAGRASVLALPFVGLFIYFMLYLLNHFPQAHNFPVEVTEENAERLYRASSTFMSLLNFEVVFFMTLGAYEAVQVGFGGDGFGAAFMPTFLFVVFGTIGFFIYRLFRLR